MKRFAISLLILLLLNAAIGGAYLLLAPVRPEQEKFVLLRPGMGARQIAGQLEREGLIRSARVFLAWHYIQGQPVLHAGEYRFEQPAGLRSVYQRVREGDIYYHVLVIPEGYNIFDIGQALEAATLAGRDEFVRLANSELALIADLAPQAKSLEGYLFPDTYRFTRTQSARDMMAQMVRRFRQEAQAAGLANDVHRMVTLASIIEKETSVPGERTLVSSVYHNRLQRGMPLAADPTVVYAALLAGRYRGTIYRSDLDFDSPYNTYRYAGLPPGPIANPGREALRAALAPAQTDYLFFVADNRGGHRFARTYDQHVRNVADYRRGLGQGGSR